MLLKRLYLIANLGSLASASWFAAVQKSWVGPAAIGVSLLAIAALLIKRLSIPLLASLVNIADGILLLFFIQSGGGPLILIYIFWTIYFLANTLLIRHALLEGFLYAFAFTPLFFQKSDLPLYGSLALYFALLNGYGSKLVRESVRKVEEDKARLLVSLEEITQTQAVTRSAIDLAVHDIAGI
ncbi:MAG: hypothetical protein JNM63_04610, partial [Spirochaetia bacterium]|nr:hypothetical protein [Spirochaetia bacterium]